MSLYNFLWNQQGGGKCSLCGSLGVTKTTCPLNKDAKNPNPQKHPLAKSMKMNETPKETKKEMKKKTPKKLIKKTSNETPKEAPKETKKAKEEEYKLQQEASDFVTKTLLYSLQSSPMNHIVVLIDPEDNKYVIPFIMEVFQKRAEFGGQLPDGKVRVILNK